MIRARSGQQMLWSFAGTTGAMTVLTEKHLESLGRDLAGLKPAGMRRSRKKASRPDRESGCVRLYLYGDGTASETYHGDKARLRFDRMKDSGGFDWQREKYDPNYRVDRRGWFGALSEEGDWVMVDEQTGQEAGISAEPGKNNESIQLIYTLDGPLLIDTALLLGKEEEAYYYTLEGELYGAVKNDPASSWKNVETALAGRNPVGVVLPEGTGKDIQKIYREKLGNNISFYEQGTPAVQALLAEDEKQRRRAAQASGTFAACSRLKKRGFGEEEIQEILSSEAEEIQVSLNPFLKEDQDASGVPVSPETAAWLDQKQKEKSPEELIPAIPYVTALLPLLKDTPGENTALLDEAWNRSAGSPGELSGLKNDGICYPGRALWRPPAV